MTATQQTLEPIQKLTKDLREASKILTASEARFLVDDYYTMQDNRIRAAGQVRAMSKDGEPCEVLGWLFGQSEVMEKQIGRALTAYAEANPVGQWSMSICGIAGTLSAGLLAHIDIEKAPTVGHIWNFAGLNPDIKWEKGQKRPFNAKLKVLCWKIGQSFVKVSNNKNDFYGKYYKIRKEYEQAKNDKFEYKDQAERQLAKKNYGKTTEAYKHLITGKLPPGQIQQRCERYATKLFLSHWHYVAFRYKFGVEPPKPFAIAILGHAHEIEVPNNPF